MPAKRKVDRSETVFTTQKGRYPSNYSPGQTVAFPQYLAEKMCERRAQTLNRELPKQFWKTLPEWRSYFFFQLSVARKLVSKYSEPAIYKAVNELKYIYSLRIKKLEQLIEQLEDQVIIEREEVELNVIENSQGKFNRKPGKLGELD